MAGIPGHDYIGVGVGALVFDHHGRVFLAQRGPKVRNEAGTWEFPGGLVNFGERLQDALHREFKEEYGITIEVKGLLGVFDDIIPTEGQHWVSPTYLARHLAGEPTIREPQKCTDIGWFQLDALPNPLSGVTHRNLAAYLASR